MSEPKLPPKWLLKALSNANVFVYRLTGWRLWNTMQGSPICLVTMKGRKSGRMLTRPVMYTARGENVLIVASPAGSAKHPVWYHNIVANPDIVVRPAAGAARCGRVRRRPRRRRSFGPFSSPAIPISRTISSGPSATFRC